MTLAVFLVLSVLMVYLFVVVSPACAATDDIDSITNEYEAQIEEATTAYNELTEQLAQLESAIEANSARVAEIEALLPEQRELASQAAISLYKLDQDGFSPLNLLFNVGSLSDFLKNLEYMEHVQEKLTQDVCATEELQEELLSTQSALDAQRIEVDADKDAAEDALAAAISAREAAIAAAKAKAEEEAKALEEEKAKAAAEAAEKEAAKAAAAEEESDTSSSDDDDDDDETYEFVTPESDGMTGSEDRETFVSIWTPRIDAYLAGSSLAGQGATFAAAAWDYGVDPRFSPAISCIESSKGDVCFLPHNAWGWGSVSWDSWEEAINDHVAGLARGYGYTVSVDGAKRYCPPNWAFWYSRVSEEMNKI